MQQHMLGDEKLENSSAEIVLMDTKLNMTKKANGILDWIGRGVLPPLSTGEATSVVLCLVLGFPVSSHLVGRIFHTFLI